MHVCHSAEVHDVAICFCNTRRCADNISLPDTKPLLSNRQYLHTDDFLEVSEEK